MDDVFKLIKLKMRKYQIGSWKMKPINISELVYADDIVLFASSQANVQRNLEILNSELLTRNKLIKSWENKDNDDWEVQEILYSQLHRQRFTRSKKF
jgi:hypothetical protein